MTGYGLHWIHTTTGQVGPPITAHNASWSIELNKTEEISLTVDKKHLNTINPTWWEPLSGGVLLTYAAADGIARPIIAGPITDWGKETHTSLEIKAEGLRAIFERRTIWQTLEYRKTTLGEIAWALAVHAMDRPGGALPLVHGTAGDTVGERERTYEGWNLANNLVGKRWTELSGVINGPDIMIRPRWADEAQTRIEWALVHGTEAYPFIAQDWVPDFDTTADMGEVPEVSVTSSGKNLVHRIWCTGAGEGEGTARAHAEILSSVWRRDQPFVEDVMSDADQASPDVLRQKAHGELLSRQAMIDQVTLTFAANSRKTPLGSFFVGDTANVTLAGWKTIPDGTRPMRIIKMNGDLSPQVTLDFQQAQWENK